MGTKPEEHCDIFSSSAAERLINCVGSSVACKDIPNVSSTFADEGSEAHAICAYEVNTKLLGAKQDDPRPGLKYYSTEMEDCAAQYLSFVADIYEEAKADGEAVLLVEQRVQSKKYGADLFGTSDCIIYNKAKKKLIIIDYKHGQGVAVSAEDNAQLKTYALYTLETFPEFEVESITLCIFQPRKSNLSKWTITKDELLDWGESVIRITIDKIMRKVEEFHPGDHCRFCRAKPVCKALRDRNLEIAKYEFRPGFLMDDPEVEDVLGQAEQIIEWLNSVKDFAVGEAVKGHKYAHWKLVEGKSSRIFNDEIKVAETLKNAGYEPYESKLKTITTLTKELGSRNFSDLLGKYVIKPQGKLTLASREKDKRPEFNSVQADFNDDDE